MTGPLREAGHEVTSSIPEGPLGFAGKGNLIGLSGTIVVAVGRALVPGEEFDPGYKVRSHEIQRSNGVERHTFEIDAYSKSIARALAKKRSAPTNIDYVSKQTEVIQVTEVRERPTASTWSITVNVTDRGN